MAALNFKDFGRAVSVRAGFSPDPREDSSRKLKLIVFYFGVPIVIGYLLAAGRASGPDAELLSWSSVYYPLRGLVLWLMYCVATMAFAAAVKPSRNWFIPTLIVGWAIGSPIASYLGRLLFPLAAAEHGQFSIGNLSLYSLYGRPYVGLVVWIATASFFYWVIGVPLFGFAPTKPDIQPETVAETKLDKKSSPLLSRLPQHLDGDIVAIMAEEHYLRIYTLSGNALILYRLSDAVKELGEYGMLVHRSYWVARAAVTGNVKRGQNSILLLSNGLEVPVSRGYRQKVLEAGLL